MLSVVLTATNSSLRVLMAQLPVIFRRQQGIERLAKPYFVGTAAGVVQEAIKQSFSVNSSGNYFQHGSPERLDSVGIDRGSLQISACAVCTCNIGHSMHSSLPYSVVPEGKAAFQSNACRFASQVCLMFS